MKIKGMLYCGKSGVHCKRNLQHVDFHESDCGKRRRPASLFLCFRRDGSRLLPRPISLCEIDREGGRLRIVYRVAGAGTEEFSHLKAGMRLIF